MNATNFFHLKKLFRYLKVPLILIALVTITFFILQKVKLLPSFSDWFKEKPILIDNTPLVITQIKTIALLNTASLYKEMVIDSVSIQKADLPAVFYPLTFSTEPVSYKKELVLIVKGKATAGINLKNLPDSNVYVKDDSVSLKLPRPTITDFFINPSDTETFYELGKWTGDEVTAIKAIARRRLQEEATRQNLLEKAADKAHEVLTDFLKASGFTRITISFY